LVTLGVVVSAEQLNNAYGKETDAGVKESFLSGVSGLTVCKHPRWQKENWINPGGGPTSG
jgi:hypothetical protein